MRFTRLLVIIFLTLIAGASHAAADPADRFVLLVEPARADFDQDGRPDVAAPGSTGQTSVVLITLSKSGERELDQPGEVVAIAGFDYDGDGDVDLLVGTAEGALVWLNNGRGGFASVPVRLPSVPHESSRLTSVDSPHSSPIERDDPAAFGAVPVDHAFRPVANARAPQRLRARASVPSTSSPRAPPSLAI